MDEDKLKRVFDQIKPTQEQEQVMLDRLLIEQKEVKPVSRMKKMPAVLTAAVVLLLACAFTVATGIDQRLLDYFGAGAATGPLLADGMIPVHQSHTYENGWTVEIGQVVADRYSVVVLTEVTAPEGVKLEGDYRIDLRSDLMPEEETGVGGHVSGSTQIGDGDPRDNRITLLWHRGPTFYLKSGPLIFFGKSLTLSPLLLKQDGGPLYVEFPKDEWSATVELPREDSGVTYAINQAITVDGERIVVKEVYISPVSLAYDITTDVVEGRMFLPPEISDWEGQTAVDQADGRRVAAKETVSATYDPLNGTGTSIFRLEEMIDPAQVSEVTILGQTFSLGGLLPVEE